MSEQDPRFNGAKPQYSVDDWRIVLRVSPLDDETVLNPGETAAFQQALNPNKHNALVDPFHVVEHEGHYLVDFFVNRTGGETAIGECAMRALEAIEITKLPAKIDRAGIAPQRTLRFGTATIEAYMRLDDVTMDLEDWLAELQPDTSTLDSELSMLLFDES